QQGRVPSDLRNRHEAGIRGAPTESSRQIETRCRGAWPGVTKREIILHGIHKARALKLLHSDEVKRRAIVFCEFGLSCRETASHLNEETGATVTPQTVAR